MKLALNILGGLMIVVGAVWVLQGLSILPGSFMMGKITWIGNGAWLVAFATGLLVWNNRAKKPD